MKSKTVLLTILLTTHLLAGCSPATAPAPTVSETPAAAAEAAVANTTGPASTPTETNTPQPSDTPEPTRTPAPSSTPDPTTTFTVTPTPGPVTYVDGYGGNIFTSQDNMLHSGAPTINFGGHDVYDVSQIRKFLQRLTSRQSRQTPPSTARRFITIRPARYRIEMLRSQFTVYLRQTATGMKARSMAAQHKRETATGTSKTRRA